MTNLKRILSLVLVLTLAVGMAAVGTSAAKFSDVASAYSYSSEVQFLSDLGIITGYSDGSYKPEGIVTRAEAVAVIYRMLSGKTSAANYTGDTRFPDVKAAHWASGYINFAVELGVVNGYLDGNFYPDKTLSYAEYVTMLVRALGLDSGKSPAYPYGYIALASIEGVNDSVDLQADQSCTRGAVAKLTYNSILDATYARMANNIYVTEKPTIAKNILKLNAVQGVLTSAGYYDFTGSNPAGEGKFRLDKITTSGVSGGTYVTSSGTFTGEFNVDVSDLGKKAKVWYKTDTSTASGDKVYAVITEDSNLVSYNHHDLKGNLDATKHELTYVVNEDDKTLKFSDTANFISNNQWIGVSTLSNPYQDTFYPSSKREWLPITYTFIDNDKDGKYDFAIRKSYGFAKIVNMTSSKLQLDGQPSIDRLDDSDDSYDWNDTLSGISVDDYVLYYADGSTNIGANPSFSSSLYSDTNHASFTKIAKKTGTLNSIVNGDEFILDSISYRTLSGGENPDLLSSSEIGKTYDYYPIANFGIVAKSELQDPSSGKYIIITGKAAASLGSNFDISAINESGKNDVYTVKGSSSSGLSVYNKTTSAVTMGDGSVVAANSSKTVPLTIANVNSTVGGSFGSNFYEYTLDSAGKISSLKSYIVPSATIASGYSGYNNTSKLVVSTNGTYLVDDATLVFVKQGAGTYKVFTGNFPKITDASATNTVHSVDFKTSSGTNKLRAMYITTDASSVTGSSSNSGVAGYLRSVSKLSVNQKWYYKYTIAFAGSDSSEFYSKSVDSNADLAGMLVDEGLPENDSYIGGVVTFDINNDGTISNMIQKKTKNNVTVNSDGDYYGTHKVVDLDTSNRVLTLAPLTGAAVTAGARLTGIGSDTSVIGDTTPILGTNVITGPQTSYRYANDVKVYAFDWNTTDQASVTVESIGSVQRSTENDLYMVSFGFDDDKSVITDIFFNKRAWVPTAVTPVVPPAASRIAYYNGATDVTAYTTDTATAVGVGVKLANTSSDTNISIAAGGITGQIINNSTGVVTAVTGLNAGAMVALPGNTITLGSITNTVATAGTYTVIINAVAGSTTYTKQLALTITAPAADVTAANAVIASITALGATPTTAAVNTAKTAYDGLSAPQQALVTNSATLLTFVADQTAATATIGLITTANAAATNTNITAARTAYDALSTWGKNVVTNYTTLTGLETALVTAKTTLATNITTAQTLYTAQIARLNTFTAVEVASITAEDATQPMAYSTALSTLNTAIATANAFDPEAGAATAATITTAATTMSGATTAANTAKTAFDALASVSGAPVTITGYYTNNTGADTALTTTATVAYGTAEATALSGLTTNGYAKLSDNSYVAITITWAFDAAYNGNIAGAKAVTGTVSGTFPGGQTPTNRTGTVTVSADTRTITGYYINNTGADTALTTTATVAYGTAEATALSGLTTNGYAKLSDNSYVAITITWAFDAAYNGNIAGAKAVTGIVSGTFPGGQTPTNRTGTVTVSADTRTITGYYINNTGADTALTTTATVAYGTAEATALSGLTTNGYAKLSDNSYVAITITWAFDAAYNGNIAGAKAVTGIVSGTFPGGQTPTNRTGTVTVSADTRTITGYYTNNTGADTALTTTATVAYGTAEATALSGLTTNGYAKLSDNSYVAITITWAFDAAYNGNIAGAKAVTGTVSGTFPGGQTPTNRTGTVTVSADTRTITGYYTNNTGADTALTTTATVANGTDEATALSELTENGYAKLSDNSYVAITISWAFDGPYSSTTPDDYSATGTVSGTFPGGQTPTNRTGTITVSP